MGKIAILPDILCNQIAAGEVVERPAAVVKELVENSIDAGSSRITVSLLQGGRKEIRVIDNGCGMGPEDALLAVERHATSKIRSAEDLHGISTLGFRGEALPSIASVSRFELITRENDSLSGMHIVIDGGVLRDVRERGCPAGTQIVVRDLFHNVPARRKFMRTAETELAYITDQFLRIAMAEHGTHLQLCSQDRLIHDFPRVSDRSHRASRVLGQEVSKSLTPFEFEKNSIRVSGYLASPHVQRTNSQGLFLFVNGRPVWDRLLQRTVLTAYEALIPRGKFPVAVLFVELPPEAVDVNVHPAKREIRFRNPGEIIETIREAALLALSSFRPAVFSSSRAPSSFKPEPGAFQPAPGTHQQNFFRQKQAAFNTRPQEKVTVRGWDSPGTNYPDSSPFPEPNREQASAADAPSFRDVSDPPDSPGTGDISAPEAGPAPGDSFTSEAGPATPSFSALPVIGQFANAFLLLEASDGLIIIDQHAAHERILFNELSSRSRAAKASQLLTTPVVIDLMPGEAVFLNKWLSGLAELGFEIEPFGGSSFALHAVPSLLSGVHPEELVRDFLKFAEDGGPANEAGLIADIVKIASCKSAVKAGRKLKTEEIRHLTEALDRTDCPFTCPHGRPLWFKLTYDQILRFFKRT